MISKKLKDRLVLAGGSLMLAGWVAVFIWGKPTPPISALSPGAKETVLSYTKEFCRGLYGEAGCNTVDVFGKHRWIVTVSIQERETSSLAAIEGVLQSDGWTRSASAYERKTVFCKGTFGAVSEHPNGFVKFVVFVSSHDDCLR